MFRKIFSTESKLLLFLFLLCAIIGACSPIVADDVAEDPLVLEGRLNAVQKARLLTDISFVPQNQFQGNGMVYQDGVEYNGMIYSSVKELGTYVGNNVSIYTFLTAINNPRSIQYTDDISKLPYNGTNCHSYYGTVCSAFVSFALGLSPAFGSYDFPVSDLFDTIHYSSPEDLKLADVLWYPGHVAMVTAINQSGNHVKSVEISQAVGEGCVRRFYTREEFEDMMWGGFQFVFRYNAISRNTQAASDFSADNSNAAYFSSNSKICANKGDKYCYFEDEVVILNVFSDYKSIEVYKDNEFYTSYDEGYSGDLSLSDLPYGKYCAKLFLVNGELGGSTEWITVDASVQFDSSSNTIYFSSSNSTPESARLTKINGGRKAPFTEVYSHLLTQQEVSSGKAIVPISLLNDECPYYSVTFKTEFGRISLRPRPWKDII